jgi:hypothetical protein
MTERVTFGSPGWDRQNKRDILRGNIERDSASGRGVRPHEVEHAVDIAESMFHGQTSNGEATKKAIKLIREGLA